MTEEEAKTKWCPFVRLVGMQDRSVISGQSAFNRSTQRDDPEIPNAARCIGSACMAWRDSYDVDYDTDAPFHSPDRMRKNGGYCGLANR